MDRKKKIMAAVIALVIVAVGSLIYWGQDVSLQRFFPNGQWYSDMSLLGAFFEGHVIFEVDEDTADTIFTHLNTAELKRGLPFDSWRGDSIMVSTFYGDDIDYWIQILLIDDGRVQVVDFGKEKEYYFRGGEELYSQILAIAETLPAEEEN